MRLEGIADLETANRYLEEDVLDANCELVISTGIRYNGITLQPGAFLFLPFLTDLADIKCAEQDVFHPCVHEDAKQSRCVPILQPATHFRLAAPSSAGCDTRDDKFMWRRLVMKTVQPGDRVRVHYVKLFGDGSSASSRSTGPLALTVGVEHPRLPGLGPALVGMCAGDRTTVTVPAENAYGLRNPERCRVMPRSRFAKDQQVEVGKWLRIVKRDGRYRRVRVLEIRDDSTVLVDTNHRGAGQAMEVKIKLVAIDERFQ
jgi:peptidylprolyl isomerase